MNGIGNFASRRPQARWRMDLMCMWFLQLISSTGIGRTLKNICEPVYEKLKTNLETAGATKALSSKVHTALTSSQIKDLYECYAHCFIGTIRRKQRLELIFIMKEIMMIMMARYIIFVNNNRPFLLAFVSDLFSCTHKRMIGRIA